jgi:hypothetical protein
MFQPLDVLHIPTAVTQKSLHLAHKASFGFFSLFLKINKNHSYKQHYHIGLCDRGTLLKYDLIFKQYVRAYQPSSNPATICSTTYC